MDAAQTVQSKLIAYSNEILKLLHASTQLKTRQISFKQFLAPSTMLSTPQLSKANREKELQKIMAPLLQKLSSTCIYELSRQNATIEQVQIYFSSNLLRNIKEISLKFPKLQESFNLLGSVNSIIIKCLQQILLLYSNQLPIKHILFSKKLQEIVRYFQKHNFQRNSFFQTTQISIEAYVSTIQHAQQRNISNKKQKNEYFRGIRNLIHKIIQQTHLICQQQQEQETIHSIYKKFLALLISQGTNNTYYIKEAQKCLLFDKLLSNNQQKNQQINIQQSPQFQQILQKLQLQGKLFLPNYNNTENNIYQQIQVYQLLKQWIKDHEQIFENPQKYIFSKNEFKTISNRTLHSLQHTSKLKMIRQIKLLTPKVKQDLQNLQQEYRLFQQYFFNFQAPHQQTFLMKDQHLRSFSSSISKTIINSFAERHLQILIHYLLKAGTNIIDKPSQTINLLNFSTKNLLKSELICNQKTIINILNILSSIHHQNFTIENVQFSTIRNRPVINVVCVFFKKFQSTFHLFPEKIKSKYNKSNHVFNAFVWKLTNNFYGAIAQSCLIYCKNDVLAYKLFKRQDSLKNQDSDIISQIQTSKQPYSLFRSIFEKNKDIFICCKCGMLKINQKYIYTDNSSCAECTLKNSSNLQNIQNFFKEKCRRITAIQQFLDNQIIFVHQIKNQYLRIQNKMQIYQVKQFKGLSDLLLFPINSIQYYSKQKSIQYFQLTNLYKTWKNGEIIYSIERSKLQLINDKLSKFMEENQGKLKKQYSNEDYRKTIRKIEELQRINVYLEQLQILDLSNNFDKFQDWINLLKINKFIKLPHEINLSRLSLQKDPFTQLKAHKNIDHTMLKILNLSNNKLASINLNLFSSLTNVNISYNQISNHLDLRLLPHLETLNACKNKVASIHLPSNNQKHAIQSAKSDRLQNRLRILNLAYNKFKQQFIVAAPSIEQLDISNNHIQSINLSIAINLHYLDLSFNQLTKVSLTANTQLQILHLQHNQLEQIDMTKNVKLKEIFIHENRMKKQINFLVYRFLEKIYAGKNQFTRIMLSYQFLFLKEIYFSHTKIKQIVLNYQNLTYFELTDGELQLILIRENPKLETMILQSNKLTQINLQHCSSLKFLDLTSNKLTQLNLSRNKKLEDIHLYNNALQTLILPQSETLRYLDCRENQLKQLALCISSSILADNVLLNIDAKIKNQSISKIISRLEQNRNVKYESIVLEVLKNKVKKQNKIQKVQQGQQIKSEILNNTNKNSNSKIESIKMKQIQNIDNF